MTRRDLIAILASTAAVSLPGAVRAQQPAIPVIGFLSSRAPENNTNLTAAFHRGLKEAGYIEGQNLIIEYRWANNDHERLPDMAADLVRTMIAATGGNISAVAAKATTKTIPIVFTVGGDPVELGLV